MEEERPMEEGTLGLDLTAATGNEAENSGNGAGLGNETVTGIETGNGEGEGELASALTTANMELATESEADPLGTELGGLETEAEVSSTSNGTLGETVAEAEVVDEQVESMEEEREPDQDQEEEERREEEGSRQNSPGEKDTEGEGEESTTSVGAPEASEASEDASEDKVGAEDGDLSKPGSPSMDGSLQRTDTMVLDIGDTSRGVNLKSGSGVSKRRHWEKRWVKIGHMQIFRWMPVDPKEPGASDARVLRMLTNNSTKRQFNDNAPVTRSISAAYKRQSSMFETKRRSARHAAASRGGAGGAGGHEQEEHVDIEGVSSPPPSSSRPYSAHNTPAQTPTTHSRPASPLFSNDEDPSALF